MYAAPAFPLGAAICSQWLQADTASAGADTYVLRVLMPLKSQQQKQFPVLLEAHNARKLCEHGRDVEEVVVHGVLPSGASLKVLVERCLFNFVEL